MHSSTSTGNAGMSKMPVKMLLPSSVVIERSSVEDVGVVGVEDVGVVDTGGAPHTTGT